jgi:carboxylesterase type B
MWSNGPGVQPKSDSLAQIQFNELLSALGISHTLSAAQKLSALRSLPARTLLDAVKIIAHNQFRPWSDSAFISRALFHDIDNGSFAHRLRARKVRLMIGECRDEHVVYGAILPPKEDSLASLRRRLEADYPPDVCDALVRFYYPTGKLPENCSNWFDAFGRLYADIQVHMLERGFINALAHAGARHMICRYRIEYRAKCLNRTFPFEGVTHGTDQALWFWGNGDLLEDEEKEKVKVALIDPLVRFVQGKHNIHWGTRGYLQARRLRPDMETDAWEDTMWEDGTRVWNVLRNVGSMATGKLAANL